MAFNISGGMEQGTLGEPDDLADWLGQDEIPRELRCVEIKSNSKSEGMIFKGDAGDSGICTSPEGSRIDWSDNEDEQSTPATTQIK